jgi:hypothetical protein
MTRTVVSAIAVLGVLASPLAYAAPSMLPADLRDKYLSMQFEADGESVQFQLEHLKYQNLGRKVLINMDLKSKVLMLANQELKKDEAGVSALVAPVHLKQNSPVFMHVFSGKGSPDEIQAVLKLAARFKTKLGAAWKDKGSLSESIKQFYYNNIGLDCSGFAGNYARAIGSKYGPDTPILSFAPAGKRVKKLADVAPGDVLVWKNNQHIATLQGKRDDGFWDVVESNGDPFVKGLGNTVWELKDGKSEVIVSKVVKGKASSPSQVYIATSK